MQGSLSALSYGWHPVGFETLGHDWLPAEYMPYLRLVIVYDRKPHHSRATPATLDEASHAAIELLASLDHAAHIEQSARASISSLPPTSLQARARMYLDRMPPSTQGQNGSRALFNAALVLVRGFALSTAEALPLLAEWNDNAQPPWPRKALEQRLQQAARSDRVRLGWLVER